MEKELSDIISNVFYGTTFEYKKAKRTWKRPKNRLLSGENPLIWVDTPSAVENKKWSESMKYRNVKEAKIVSEIVNALSPKDVDVKILRVDLDERKIGLSLKRAQGDDEVDEGDDLQQVVDNEDPPSRGGMDDHGALGTDKIDL